MRTALIAASVAFVFIAPLAIEASGPRMTSEAFVSAVRCAAHEAATGPRSANAAERAWLNIGPSAKPLGGGAHQSDQHQRGASGRRRPPTRL